MAQTSEYSTISGGIYTFVSALYNFRMDATRERCLVPELASSGESPLAGMYAFFLSHSCIHLEQLVDVLRGLEFLHSCHVVHGDLKGVSICASRFMNFVHFYDRKTYLSTTISKLAWQTSVYRRSQATLTALVFLLLLLLTIQLVPRGGWLRNSSIQTSRRPIHIRTRLQRLVTYMLSAWLS
jgi:hypothetical protein